MPIPKAVQEAEARATEMMRQVAEHRDAAPPPNEQQPQPQPVQQSAPPAGDPGRMAIVDDEAVPPDAKLEHQHRVLQGKYRAEVVEVNRRNRELESENQSLKAELERLKQAPAAQPNVSVEDVITPEEREQYGEDFINFLTKVSNRVARVNVAPAFDMSAVDAKLQPVADRSEQTAKRLFFSDLTGVAPNWRALNRDDGFLAWLAEIDQYTGQTRQVLFDDAFSQLDVERIAAFFNSYGQSVGAATPNLPTFEEQVVPNTSSPNPPPPPGKRIWTQAAISQFYNDVREGKVKKDDAAVIEQDIFAAQREGRVRMGRPR